MDTSALHTYMKWLSHEQNVALIMFRSSNEAVGIEHSQNQDTETI
jgi:hypothetical protein